MPRPVGRPEETVSPEVSECSRMPDSRRPAASATTPCAPSWAMVTTCRVARQSAGERTRTAAAAAAASRTVMDRSGTVAVTRTQNPARTSTGRVNRTDLGGPGGDAACRRPHAVRLTPPRGRRGGVYPGLWRHERTGPRDLRRATGHGLLHPARRPGARPGDDRLDPSRAEHGRGIPG